MAKKNMKKNPPQTSKQKGILWERFGNGETTTVALNAEETYNITQALSRLGVPFRCGSMPQYIDGNFVRYNDTIFVMDVEKLREAMNLPKQQNDEQKDNT